MAKKIYTKEEILQNAFELCCNSGIDTLSVRMLAKRVGCSVMPIYDSFDSKEGLIEALINYAITKTFPEETYSSFIERYMILLEYAMKYPKFYLDIARVTRRINIDKEHIRKLTNMMRRESKLMYLPFEVLQTINSLIEFQLLGLIMYESSTGPIKEGMKDELRRYLSNYITRIINSYKKST